MEPGDALFPVRFAQACITSGIPKAHRAKGQVVSTVAASGDGEFGVPVSNNERRDDQESFGGARKLIRPLLSAVTRRRRDPTQPADPLTHALLSETHGVPASTHAEAFYFQKQIQQGTDLTIVLEDGEELHGVLEWYDRCAVKLRAGRFRVLIYKSAIKYLFKTSDAHITSNIMR